MGFLLIGNWVVTNAIVYSTTPHLCGKGSALTHCDRCGIELPEGTNFCPKCGSKLGRVVTEQFTVNLDNLIKRVKDLLHEGNVTKIIVKDEQGKLLLELPATAGLIGVVLAPWLAALGTIAALVKRCTISVEKKE